MLSSHAHMFQIFLSWRHLLYQRDVVSFEQDPSCKDRKQLIPRVVRNAKPSLDPDQNEHPVTTTISFAECKTKLCKQKQRLHFTTEYPYRESFWSCSWCALPQHHLVPSSCIRQNPIKKQCATSVYNSYNLHKNIPSVSNISEKLFLKFTRLQPGTSCISVSLKRWGKENNYHNAPLDSQIALLVQPYLDSWSLKWRRKLTSISLHWFNAELTLKPTAEHYKHSYFISQHKWKGSSIVVLTWRMI